MELIHTERTSEGKGGHKQSQRAARAKRVFVPFTPRQGRPNQTKETQARGTKRRPLLLFLLSLLLFVRRGASAGLPLSLSFCRSFGFVRWPPLSPLFLCCPSFSLPSPPRLFLFSCVRFISSGLSVIGWSSVHPDVRLYSHKTKSHGFTLSGPCCFRPGRGSVWAVFHGSIDRSIVDIVLPVYLSLLSTYKKDSKQNERLALLQNAGFRHKIQISLSTTHARLGARRPPPPN